jgi:hypothetical protein
MYELVNISTMNSTMTWRQLSAGAELGTWNLELGINDFVQNMCTCWSRHKRKLERKLQSVGELIPSESKLNVDIV